MNEHIRNRKRNSYWAHSCALYVWRISIWQICSVGWWERIPSCAQSPCWPEAIVLNWILCASPWSIDNLKSHPPAPDQSPCLLPGFRVLSDFLAHHVHIPEVYLIVSTFFLQTPLTELVDGPKVGSRGSRDGLTTFGFLISVSPKTLLAFLHVFQRSSWPTSLPSSPTSLLALQISLTSSASASLVPPSRSLVFISSTFKVFSLWVDTPRDGGGNMGKVNCCHHRRRASFYHLQRNMCLCLSNAPAFRCEP